MTRIRAAAATRKSVLQGRAKKPGVSSRKAAPQPKPRETSHFDVAFHPKATRLDQLPALAVPGGGGHPDIAFHPTATRLDQLPPLVVPGGDGHPDIAFHPTATTLNELPEPVVP